MPLYRCGTSSRKISREFAKSNAQKVCRGVRAVDFRGQRVSSNIGTRHDSLDYGNDQGQFCGCQDRRKL
ncbi:hypothetical protein RRG08_061120 [Elysia crispata]|uniref:Uncharacterized protein n=1 Tax=Elysia crispata TaxID=231223 RepID=A0AAE0XDG0_9GAST|nr:hypothetical protein RRG08_061120 [Elysia crispata]